jgi:hypothetical protein
VVLNQISEFRDFALKNCSWSPLDFVPYQQFLWIYGPGSKGYYKHADRNDKKYIYSIT